MDSEESKKKIYMQLFKSIIEQISTVSSDVLLDGAGKLLDDETVIKHINEKKIQPYLYLSGFLNLLGRDINTENMSKVLNAIGIKPDEKLMNVLLDVNNENVVIYVYSIYFLVILGKEHCIKNIVKLVGSLGVNADEALA